MDLRIELYKAAFSQTGNGFDFPVFRGTSRYQYGQSLNDVLRGIVRFIPMVAQFLKPVAIKGVQTILKAGSEAIKEGATVKDVITFTLKLTVGVVLGTTLDQAASKLIEMRNNQNDAPSSNPPIMLPELNQAGSGKTRRSRTVYKKTPKRSKYSSNQRPIIYNFLNGDIWRLCDGANYKRG